MSLTSAVRSSLKASTTLAARFAGFIREEAILIVSLRMREVGLLYHVRIKAKIFHMKAKIHPMPETLRERGGVIG